MNVSDAIAQRRSIKKFQDTPVTREEIEALLNAAVLAPNHHLTQPWRFYVLGPESRRRYGLALGERKARKLTDPDAANAVREKTAADHVAYPALIAVVQVLHESPETRPPVGGIAAIRFRSRANRPTMAAGAGAGREDHGGWACDE